jgi:hypothetical protein
MTLPQWIIAARTEASTARAGTSSRPPKRVRPDWGKRDGHARSKAFQEKFESWKERVLRPAVPIVENETTKKYSLQRMHAFTSGPLHLNEYRFWRASGTNGCCRLCMAIVPTTAERRAHQRERSCTVKLVDAYKLLLKDMKCVVCDTKTTHKMWGVPLCGQTCIARWQFEAGAGTWVIHLAAELVEQRTSKVLPG